MAAATIPLADFTPYLLQQTALRASLLQASFGFAADEWDDLRQDLALDCLRRLPRFDGSRGNWQGFVRGVVRHQACVLASRQKCRRQFQPLDESECADGRHEPAEDLQPVFELGLDTERVLAGLPDELASIARLLAEMPVSAVRRKTCLTAAQLNRRVARIRAAFMRAGLSPATRGGARD